MFFVLRNVESGVLLARGEGDGPRASTKNLQEAQLFNMTLEPEHLDREPTGPAEAWGLSDPRVVTTGTIKCEVKDPQIPAGLPGRWEIVPVDLRLT